MPLDPPPVIDRFAALAPRYDVLLSDVWGVVHNGLAAFPEACDALARFRAGGGSVILITNAPRPGEVVMRMLDRLAMPRAAYDGIVSSGDLTRAVVAERPGQSVFHLGPERDRAIFAGLDLAFAAMESADYIVCTGLFDDENETAEDYRALLGAALGRNLYMVCANPDVVVERGDRLVYCAGALARAYEQLGGGVSYAGKPYLPIYQLAFETLDTLRPGSSERVRLLAIGDGVHTDIAGAAAADVRSVFVSSGVHVTHELDTAMLETLFPPGVPRPVAAMARLTW